MVKICLNIIYIVSLYKYTNYILHILQCDEDPPHAFSQVFVLKANAGTYYVAHDIFRLNIHNSA